MSARQQAVLRELTIWRDGCARDQNVPARAFLKDEVLLDLARNPVKAVEKLERVRGLPRPVEQSHGADIVLVTARGLAAPVADLPAQKDFEPTPQQRFRADSAFAAFLCLCSGRSIDPALVASRQEVGELFRAVAAGERVDNHSMLTGWRGEAVGKAMVDLLNGKLKMRLEWDGRLKTTRSASDA